MALFSFCLFNVFSKSFLSCSFIFSFSMNVFKKEIFIFFSYSKDSLKRVLSFSLFGCFGMNAFKKEIGWLNLFFFFLFERRFRKNFLSYFFICLLFKKRFACLFFISFSYSKDFLEKVVLASSLFVCFGMDVS